jgi:hypothetical protein
MPSNFKMCTAGGLSLLAVMTFSQLPANAAQFSLDWGDVAQNGQWPSGSQSGSFDIGDGNVEVSFQVGSGVQFVEFTSSGLTPAVNTVLNGANPDNVPALHLQIDADQVGLGDPQYSVVMDTRFTGYADPLENVSFWLHDIDISPDLWQDRVSIQGFLGDQLVNPTFDFLSSTIEVVDTFTLDGIASADNDSNQGDVQVSFGSAIDRWSLTYSDGDDIAVSNPGSHGIGIGDIYFTVRDDRDDPRSVPEPSAGLAILLVGAGLFTLKGRQHRSESI